MASKDTTRGSRNNPIKSRYKCYEGGPVSDRHSLRRWAQVGRVFAAPRVRSPRRWQQAGAEMLERLSNAAAEALVEILRGELPRHEWHSPIWKVRWLFTSRAVGWAFERWARYETEVW